MATAAIVQALARPRRRDLQIMAETSAARARVMVSQTGNARANAATPTNHPKITPAVRKSIRLGLNRFVNARNCATGRGQFVFTGPDYSRVSSLGLPNGSHARAPILDNL